MVRKTLVTSEHLKIKMEKIKQFKSSYISHFKKYGSSSLSKIYSNILAKYVCLYDQLDNLSTISCLISLGGQFISDLTA